MNAPKLASSADAGLYAEAMAVVLAREEAAGRRPHRILEEGTTTWSRFRGRLSSTELLALLLEDAAYTQPIPFDVSRVLGSEQLLSRLSPVTVDGLFAAARAQEFDSPSADYLASQAKRLGVSTRLAKAELHVVKSHQRVLELPGSGGQLSLHLALKYDLPFREVFTIACGTWQELALAGLAAVECRVSGPAQLHLDPDLSLRKRSPVPVFDFVVGLDPKKGGAFEKRTLESWFPSAIPVLV